MGRKITDLIPEVRERWEASEAEWKRRHPNGPEVIVTQTLRTAKEQDALFAQGRTKPGKVVTNARAGQSLHNYGMAFDVAFRDKVGEIDWNNLTPFKEFGEIGKLNGLAWGGDWARPDYPHFEPPNGYTWRDAKAGKKPTFGPITTSAVVSGCCPCCGQVMPANLKK